MGNPWFGAARDTFCLYFSFEPVFLFRSFFHCSHFNVHFVVSNFGRSSCLASAHVPPLPIKCAALLQSISRMLRLQSAGRSCRTSSIVYCRCIIAPSMSRRTCKDSCALSSAILLRCTLRLERSSAAHCDVLFHAHGRSHEWRPLPSPNGDSHFEGNIRKLFVLFGSSRLERHLLKRFVVSAQAKREPCRVCFFVFVVVLLKGSSCAGRWLF